MLIVYVIREDETDLEGWFRGGYLTEDMAQARMFKKLNEVCQIFADYCEYKKVQFDIYEVTFDGWAVGEHDFHIEAEADGAARVLNLPVVRCRRRQESFIRLLKVKHEH